MGRSVGAAELLTNGGFEDPKVEKKTPSKEGANLAGHGWNRDWGFGPGEGGEAEVGLTPSDPHSGRQSFYVTFRNLTHPWAMGYVATDSVRVVSGQTVTLGIWGKLDAKDPMEAESGQVSVYANVVFLRADGTKVSEKAYGKPAAGVGGKRFFDETDWKLHEVNLEAPPEAVTMTVAWAVQIGGEGSKASGTVLLDDASIMVPQP